MLSFRRLLAPLFAALFSTLLLLLLSSILSRGTLYIVHRRSLLSVVRGSIKRARSFRQQTRHLRCFVFAKCNTQSLVRSKQVLNRRSFVDLRNELSIRFTKIEIKIKAQTEARRVSANKQTMRALLLQTLCCSQRVCRRYYH